jgi:hypothetical protein
MRIKELLLDIIAASHLFEMAEHRKNLIQKIHSYAYQIDTHLLKVIMYGKVSSYSHWCSEINVWLKTVQAMKLKGSKKRLSKEDYLKQLWESLLESIEEVQSHMEEIDREYSHTYKMIQYDPALVHKEVYDILHDISHDISLGKFTDIKNYV